MPKTLQMLNRTKLGMKMFSDFSFPQRKGHQRTAAYPPHDRQGRLAQRSVRHRQPFLFGEEKVIQRNFETLAMQRTYLQPGVPDKWFALGRWVLAAAGTKLNSEGEKWEG